MENESKTKSVRVPSTVQFPYSDMSDAIAVAEGLLKGGGVPLSRDQLAAAMGLAPLGGGFATKVATARTFGVLESVSGKYILTELGHEIVDPSRQADAKVKAFLNVELYKKTYEEFRAKLLPPRPYGLEAAFISFGVTHKNVRHARLAFEKSARLAGLYPGGNEDRLVMPFGASAPVAAADEASTPEAPSNEVQRIMVRHAGDIHPSIMGMVEELPPAKSAWSKAEQADWLSAMATMFRVIYKADDGTITVSHVKRSGVVETRAE